MILGPGRLAGLLIGVGLAGAASGQTAPSPAPQCHIYAGIIQVTVDTAGHITGLRMERVIDPAGPGTEEEVARRAVRIDLPPEWLRAVRAHLERQHYPGSPSVFYTYAFYNPARPAEANPDPSSCDPGFRPST